METEILSVTIFCDLIVLFYQWMNTLILDDFAFNPLHVYNCTEEKNRQFVLQWKSSTPCPTLPVHFITVISGRAMIYPHHSLDMTWHRLHKVLAGVFRDVNAFSHLTFHAIGAEVGRGLWWRIMRCSSSTQTSIPSGSSYFCSFWGKK